MYEITDIYTHFEDILHDNYEDRYIAISLEKANQIVMDIQHIQGMSWIYVKCNDKLISFIEKIY